MIRYLYKNPVGGVGWSGVGGVVVGGVVVVVLWKWEKCMEDLRKLSGRITSAVDRFTHWYPTSQAYSRC